MLWYKAWRESRTRFLLSGLLLTGVCAFAVLYYIPYCRQEQLLGHEPLNYAQYIWLVIFRGGNSLRELFVFLVLLLGVGGLLRERAHGSVGFTLALPVRRWRLILARGTVGVIEVTALSFVPAAAIPALSALTGQSYPLAQAAQFGILWSVCGAAIYAMALSCSALFEGEYAAPVASLVALVVYSVAAALPVFDNYPFNIHAIMSGEGMLYFHADVTQLTGLPWMVLAYVTGTAIALFALVVCLTQRQNF
jgi:ABC-2 type transport system permease protein